MALGFWFGLNSTLSVQARCEANTKSNLDRKSTRLNSKSPMYLVCRLLLEKKKARDRRRVGRRELRRRVHRLRRRARADRTEHAIRLARVRGRTDRLTARQRLAVAVQLIS